MPLNLRMCKHFQYYVVKISQHFNTGPMKACMNVLTTCLQALALRLKQRSLQSLFVWSGNLPPTLIFSKVDTPKMRTGSLLQLVVRKGQPSTSQTAIFESKGVAWQHKFEEPQISVCPRAASGSHHWPVEAHSIATTRKPMHRNNCIGRI